MKNLKKRARALGLHGLLDNWSNVAGADWVEPMIDNEEQARNARSFERRTREAQLPAVTTMADFDWTWPRDISRTQVDTLFGLDFIEQADNAVLVGGQGTGKTMIAVNLAHHALVHGHTVRYAKAPDLLATLAEINSRPLLQRRLTALARYRLLVLDQVGYETFKRRHADLLYAIIERRYQKRSTILASSLGFAQWDRIFPNAASIVGTVDRLVHNATIVTIDGESWRLRHGTR